MRFKIEVRTIPAFSNLYCGGTLVPMQYNVKDPDTYVQ